MQSATGSIPYETTLSLPIATLQRMRLLCQVFKKDDGEPFDYADTQLLIISAIAGRIAPRIQLILPTQYGKSESVAQGILLRVTAKPEKWCIVAPTKDKAEIIMGYILKHIFDHPLFEDQLIFDESREKLKQHKSKDHITFKGGGEVMVLSADARNRQRTKEAMMGFGAANVVIDESALIEDDLYSTIKRMVGGHEGSPGGTFILEIGNPFTRGHFLRTWLAGRYARIWVDWQTALSEGRYTRAFIEEMQEEAFFDVLYECKFPEGEEIRTDGYRRLLPDATVENAYVDALPEDVYLHDDDGNRLKDKDGNELLDDDPILGIDVAGGGANQTTFILRLPRHGYAMVLEKNNDDDLDNQADRVVMYKRKYHIGDYRIAIDDGGVGHGLGDILKNKHDLLFKRVLAGEGPHKQVDVSNHTADMKRDRSRYANTKAMLAWRLRKWLKAEEGKLVKDPGFEEIKIVYYKQNTSEKIQIEPKEKLRERNIPSPDTYDGLALTFVDTSQIVDEDDIYVD